MKSPDDVLVTWWVHRCLSPLKITPTKIQKIWFKIKIVYQITWWCSCHLMGSPLPLWSQNRWSRSYQNRWKRFGSKFLIKQRFTWWFRCLLLGSPLLLPVRFPFCWFYTYQNIQRHHIHPSFIHSLKHHRVCVCVCVCVCLPLILNHFYGFHGVRPRIVSRGREYLEIGVNQKSHFKFHLFVFLLSPHVCTRKSVNFLSEREA